MIRDIAQSRVLFLDSGPLVRLLQMHPDFYPAVSGVLDMAYEKNVQVLVSAVTLFEITQKAFGANEGVLARQYREFFENSKNVRCCEVNAEISVKAAELYAASQKTNHKLSENEALRLATAFVNGADCILTECANFRDATDVAVFTLDEI
ncbi:MAG: PIN domain-containing protein [Fibrobacter sp.]|uniref:type II toxin-antitoxin system VapC family toxin n=1 Tax=Fibrobacter sp. TaxID=35828 RepID=UPI0025C65FF7|nr:PIN domain-containing protein [Fibrobacter sp.]MBR4784853.1 PIN domain-containing protein [Fibrobacter sp.]